MKEGEIESKQFEQTDALLNIRKLVEQYRGIVMNKEDIPVREKMILSELKKTLGILRGEKEEIDYTGMDEDNKDFVEEALAIVDSLEQKYKNLAA